jgi:GSH-dependent disulfide-bond oxidoreductase
MTVATLYHGEPNGPSLTVLAAMHETGFATDLVAIDLVAGSRHDLDLSREVAMSIEGEGPVLLVDDVQMADSVFIARYFDEVAGGGILVPVDPYMRWETMTWCRWVIERVAPAAAFLGTKAYPPSTVVAGLQSADLQQRWDDARSGNFAAAQIADSESKIDAAVSKIERQLAGRDWLMTEFTLADLETYAWLVGMVDLVPMAFIHAPRTRAWRARMTSRPSIANALARASMPDPHKSWAPGPEINRWG